MGWEDLLSYDVPDISSWSDIGAPVADTANYASAADAFNSGDMNAWFDAPADGSNLSGIWPSASDAFQNNDIDAWFNAAAEGSTASPSPWVTAGTSSALGSIMPDWLRSALGSKELSGLAALAGIMNSYQNNKRAQDAFNLNKQNTMTNMARQNTLWAQSQAPIIAPSAPADYASMVDLSGQDMTNYGRKKNAAGQYGMQFYTNPAARALGNISAISPAPRMATGGLSSLAKMKSAAPKIPQMSMSGGQSDNVPANLSPGEYVMDADSVSALGDGDTNAGAQRLDKMRQAIRAHKRSAPADKIPPKAKSPLSYLKGAK